MMNKLTPEILVLDDDPFTLKLLARILANLGYNSVTLCESGHAALKHIDNPADRPDMILLDLNMPKMDGIEFVYQLAERHYTGSIILFSGEDEHLLQATEKLILMHGIKIPGSLRKPVSPEKLGALLDKWLALPQAGTQQTVKLHGADELRAAINNGELLNYYQPKVEPASGRVMGVETLVRWNHPRDGMVLPSEFIGLAETHGLIDELTRVVLTGALAQAKAWQEAGLVLQLAVNVSIDNLASPDFADFIAGLAAKAGVAPRDIVLEVSESHIPMNDMSAPLETLTRLRLKRFRLSIDEFGTGHSSLVQLRGIPFDELKIDQSFVHGAWSNKTVQAKYDASMAIAKQLDMEVVAVGVEDKNDWNNLRRTGCNFAQGYFIAKPMPAADLPGWIKTWHERMKE
jgi:EAL domain-containing protein (putative c-di-GMP-specific phosphodiesterase class I)